MITTMWTAAPAGFLGLGSADARAHGGFGFGTGGAACDAVRAQLQGTGLPTAVRLGAGDARKRQVLPAHTFMQIDGTTLGNHSSRRPLS